MNLKDWSLIMTGTPRYEITYYREKLMPSSYTHKVPDKAMA